MVVRFILLFAYAGRVREECRFHLPRMRMMAHESGIRSISRLMVLASGDARMTYELGQYGPRDHLLCDWKDNQACPL